MILQASKDVAPFYTRFGAKTNSCSQALWLQLYAANAGTSLLEPAPELRAMAIWIPREDGSRGSEGADGGDDDDGDKAADKDGGGEGANEGGNGGRDKGAKGRDQADGDESRGDDDAGAQADAASSSESEAEGPAPSPPSSPPQSRRHAAPPVPCVMERDAPRGYGAWPPPGTPPPSPPPAPPGGDGASRPAGPSTAGSDAAGGVTMQRFLWRGAFPLLLRSAHGKHRPSRQAGLARQGRRAAVPQRDRSPLLLQQPPYNATKSH